MTDTAIQDNSLSVIELFPQDEDWSLQTMRLLAQVAVGGSTSRVRPHSRAHRGLDRPGAVAEGVGATRPRPPPLLGRRLSPRVTLRRAVVPCSAR